MSLLFLGPNPVVVYIFGVPIVQQQDCSIQGLSTGADGKVFLLMHCLQ